MNKATCSSDPDFALRASVPHHYPLHGFQVKLVEAACKEYLLDLELSLEQLCQLVLLWVRLGNMSALKATLRKLMRKPWLAPVAQAVACVFQHLLHGDGTRLEAAKRVLQGPSCGKMCELQVSSLFKCFIIQYVIFILYYVMLYYIILYYIISFYYTHSKTEKRQDAAFGRCMQPGIYQAHCMLSCTCRLLFDFCQHLLWMFCGSQFTKHHKHVAASSQSMLSCCSWYTSSHVVQD